MGKGCAENCRGNYSKRKVLSYSSSNVAVSYR